MKSEQVGEISLIISHLERVLTQHIAQKECWPFKKAKKFTALTELRGSHARLGDLIDKLEKAHEE